MTFWELNNHFFTNYKYIVELLKKGKNMEKHIGEKLPQIGVAVRNY